MGFFKKVFKVLKKAAPIAAAFIPGLGPIASAALGAGLGAVGGGGLKGALLGGAGGYLGGASSLGGTVGGNLGKSILGSAGGQTLGRIASGALSGAATGGKEGALLGGLTGGLMANADGITNYVNDQLGGQTGMSAGDPFESYNNVINSDANPLRGAQFNIPAIQSKPAPLSSSASDAKSTVNNAGGGSSMFTTSKLSDVLSGLSNINTTNDNEEELLKAQREAQGYMSPYYQAGTGALTKLQSRLNNGFNPGDLTQDPGYQFQLEQGNRNLNRSLGAQGALFSGRALTAAQDYGQGLAGQTYQNAFNRYQQENQALANLANTGYDSSARLGDMATTYGSTKANANVDRSNTLTGLSSLLLGGRIIGWDSRGMPIYENEDRAEEVVTPAGGQ
jgi:hypothetical protein